jgi:5-methylthioribose kinase
MDYKQLDKTSVIDYLKNIKNIMEFFETDNIEAQEIGESSFNYVYLVKSIENPSKALVLKQAVPYIKSVGKNFPLSRERMTYEIRALQKFYNIFPNFTPIVYHSNEDMSLVVMEFLGNHIVMRKGLMDSIKYLNFSEHISTYMSATLFYTSSLSLCSSEKRELIDKFNSNTELCKLTEDLVFNFAFMEHENNDRANVKNNPHAKELFEDMSFKERVLELKYKFMTQSDALIHGDLNTGSIMINTEETFIIDPEFAFIGPFAFDIGSLLANLVNNYIYHSVVTKNVEFREWLLKTIKEILDKFSEKFLKFWGEYKDSALLVEGYLYDETLQSYKTRFVLNILQESVGYAGCKMVRRIFGVSGVEEIRGIQDELLRHETEALALKIAREFVMNYDKIETTDEILEIIKSSC